MNMNLDNYEELTSEILDRDDIKDIYRFKIEFNKKISDIHSQIATIKRIDDWDEEEEMEFRELQGELKIAHTLEDLCSMRIDDLKKGHYMFEKVARSYLDKSDFQAIKKRTGR